MNTDVVLNYKAKLTQIVDKIDLSYFKDKKFLKSDKKEFLEYTKILLDEIGKNDELRQQFNIEMSKHKDIFIKYGLELPKEMVDSNIKKKLKW